jgi:hypothetical protein
MMRNRSEPNQVVQAGFESGRIAVTDKVCGCYCGSARLVRLRRFKNKKLNPPKIKTSKDGQKERTDREVHVGTRRRADNVAAVATGRRQPPGPNGYRSEDRNSEANDPPHAAGTVGAVARPDFGEYGFGTSRRVTRPARKT